VRQLICLVISVILLCLLAIYYLPREEQSDFASD
jgi:hypothetical protein